MKSMKKHFHYAWLILAGCCALVFISYGICNNVAGQFITSVCQDLGFARGSFSLYLTIQGFAQLVMMPILGKLLPRLNIRRWMTGAALLMAGCFLAMSFANKLAAWWIIGIAAGIAASFLGMLPVNILLSNWFSKKHSFAVGLAMSFSGVSGVILNPLVQRVIAQYSWRLAYRVIAVITIAVLLPFTLFILRYKPQDMGMLPYGMVPSESEEQRESASVKGVSYEQARRMPELYLLIVMTAAIAFTSAMNQHLSGIAVASGLPSSVGAIAVTALMAVYVVNRLSMGTLSDVVGYQKVAIGCFLVGGFAMLAFLFCSGLSKGQFMAFAIFYAVGSSMASFMEPIVVKNVFGELDYSRIFSSVSLTLSLVGSVGISMHGFLADFTGGYRASFALNAVCFLVGIICILLIRWFGRRRSMHDAK